MQIWAVWKIKILWKFGATQKLLVIFVCDTQSIQTASIGTVGAQKLVPRKLVTLRHFYMLFIVAKL